MSPAFRPDAALYPFESHFVTLADDVRYHYLDEGQGDPVLMVHGNPTWSFYYRNLVIGLRDRCRTVVPDHVGCGLSDKPQHYPYRLAQHVRNLEDLVERLDLRDITLVVHDWGGPIGLGVAVRQPERFKRLVITNTAAFHSDFMPFTLKLARFPLVGEALIRGLNAFALGATWFALRDRKRMTKAVRAGYLGPYGSWADRIATHRFVLDIPTGPDHPSWETLVDIETRLHRLASKPKLFIWGEKDWVFTPAFLEAWLERFPGTEARRLPGVGHLVLEDAHERVVPWIAEFMARTEPMAENAGT